MTQLLASPMAEPLCIENDPELTAIAARLRETSAYALNKEELRKECLCQLRNQTITEMSGKEAIETQHDALVLSYLNHVDNLLHRFSASAKLDCDDLRQDAVLVIMHCLELKPEQQNTLHGYIYTSIRRRILDKIRYNQGHRTESLDAPLGTGLERDGDETLADFLPSGYSIDPMLVILAREEQREARTRAKEALQSLSTRRRKTKRVQDALTLFQEEVAVR